MTEVPSTHEWIDYVVATGEATELWPEKDKPETDDGPLIGALAALDLSERERDFITALSSGMEPSEASRWVGMSPRWGQRTIKRLASLCEHVRPL